MTEPDLSHRLRAAIQAHDLEDSDLEALASQLVWRIGRVTDEGPVTVRVGFATSAALFAELPRLRNASDTEIAEAIEQDELRVEWVGLRPG